MNKKVLKWYFRIGLFRSLRLQYCFKTLKVDVCFSIVMNCINYSSNCLLPEEEWGSLRVGILTDQLDWSLVNVLKKGREYHAMICLCPYIYCRMLVTDNCVLKAFMPEIEYQHPNMIRNLRNEGHEKIAMINW